jgi:hypothetical protein
MEQGGEETPQERRFFPLSPTFAQYANPTFAGIPLTVTASGFTVFDKGDSGAAAPSASTFPTPALREKSAHRQVG